MIVHGILGGLASLSFILMLWQWLAARRFPLHQRSAGLRIGAYQADSQGNVPKRSPAFPAVTLLKPIKGCDEHTEACLRSWFAQEYAGEMQILFAVADAVDPACSVIQQLIAEFPQRDAQFVVCPKRLGANAKVSKLAQLETHVKHEIIVISDADVKVPVDLLANAVAMLDDPRRATVPATGRAAAGTPVRQVGLVNCFYQLANPATLAMRLEAVAVNADFWSQVLQSKSLKPLDFALGAVMVTRREQLAEIGGFRALADCLADDYQLGHRLAKRGYRIELCPVVVECWDSPMGWGAVWRHQLRWARTIRVCQPLPYFFSLLSNATLWPLIWLAAQPRLEVLELVQVFLVGRIIQALFLQKWLTRRTRGGDFWLAPAKDLLQAVVWLLAFLGNRIEWRGEQYRLRRDGNLEKESSS